MWHTEITQFPTVMETGRQLVINTATKTKLTIYAVSGIKLADCQLIANEANIISTPNAAGVYIFVFEDAQGNCKIEKVVLK
jgi:hypothetical protein